jgi:hypothetical protein
MNRDFTIGERQFKLNKIDAFKQFHIVRRVGPVLSDMVPVMAKISKTAKEDLNEDEKLEKFGELAKPILAGLSKLSDDDSNKVLFGLLSGVEMQYAGAWGRVVVGDQLMYSDLDLPVLLQCAGRSFMFNLSGFFSALPQTSHGQK